MTSKEEVNERTHLLSQNYTQNYTGPIEGVSHPHNTARIGIRDETDIRYSLNLFSKISSRTGL